MDEDTRGRRRAIRAAEAWLAGIDAADAATTWAEAGSLFRDAVTPEDWRASLERAQKHLGRPVRRTLASAEERQELPGAPDGHYVVLRYDTEFEHKRNGTETVVPMRDEDGAWRVSGYFVR